VRRDLVAELGLGGVWVDASTSVLQTVPVTVSRGRPNEAGKVSPSSMKLALYDSSGTWSPRNPTGPYFDQLSRNVPLRLALRLLRHTFDATVSNAWAAVDGLAWTTRGSGGTVQASDWQQAGGAGTQSVPVANGYRESYLAGTAHQLVDVSVRWSIPGVSSATGASLEPGNILVRGLAPGDFYMARVRVSTGQITVSLMRQDTTVLAGPVDVGVGYVAGASYYTRVQAEGWALRVKVWRTTTAEPTGWALSVVTNWITTAGYVGVRSGIATGNTNTKPVVFSYDEFEVRSPRAYGEVVEWKPRWIENNQIRTVAVAAAGILRRLGQSTTPLRSAFYRYITGGAGGLSVVAYWTLEEDAGETRNGVPTSGGGPATFQQETGVSPAVGSIKWGGATDLPSIERAPELSAGGILVGAVDTGLIGTSWSLFWGQRIDLPDAARVLIDTSSSTFSVQIQWYTDGSITVFITLTDPLSPVTLTTLTIGPSLHKQWHHYGITAQQVGGNVAVSFVVDGVTIASTSVVATIGKIRLPQFVSELGSTGPYAVSHPVVINGVPNAQQQADLSSAFFGWLAETALARLIRLTGEKSIPFAYEGAATDTPRMGPQRPLALLPLLQECEAADLGTLYEGREAGLVYRTRASLYNQPAALTLDYSGQQVAPPFEPDEDDALLGNAWTVKRLLGGQATAELASGRLSVQDPPNGSGRVEKPVTVNVEPEALLSDIASWLLALGTIDEARYKAVQVNYAAAAITAALGWAALDVDVDDLVVITNASAVKIFDSIRQLARGYAEVLNTAYRHTETFNCAPARVYDVGVYDSSTRGRADTIGSTLQSGLTTTATSCSAVAATEDDLWSTNAADWPIPVVVAGEEMSVTNVAGTSSPQTLTITRSVNGVVKAQAANAQIRVAPWAVARAAL
jgi:hypothetical protein